MNPILFSEDTTDFSTNGLGRLIDAIKCTVTEERNGEYELYLEYPIDGHLVEEIEYGRIIYAQAADNKPRQAFRIYKITKPISGTLEIDAEHISYQLNHIPVMPFNAIGLSAALTALTTYSAEDNPFTFSSEGQFGTVIANTMKVEEPQSIKGLLAGQEGSFIDTYGGEWEYDNYNIVLHKERGSDLGVTIRYGKNLTDLKQEESIETTYTGVCPFWKSTDEESETIVTLPEMVVHSASASNYPYQRTKALDLTSSFTSQPTVEQLRNAANNYILNNDVGTPNVSLDVSFIALHQTQEYADLTKKEHINLCDTVKVEFPVLSVSTKAKVVKTVWNVLLDRYDSITIGAIGGRLSATLEASQEAAIEKAVAQSSNEASTEYATKTSVTALANSVARVDTRMYKVEHFVDGITGVNGGYVFIELDSDYITRHLYITVDAPNLNTAQKVFRFDQNGLCYTSTGIDRGSWSTIIASNGQINAAALYGTIADGVSANSWNLTTGAMALSNNVTFGGKTMTQIRSEIMAAVDTAIDAKLDALEQSDILGILKSGTDPNTENPITDNGLYIGTDGLLHMLPERIVTDGANIPSAFIPTIILNGSVSSYVQVRISHGIMYQITCDIFYYDDSGVLISSETVQAGEDAANEPTPTKADDEEYSYTFIGWSDTLGGEVISDILQDVKTSIVVYAVFEATELENGQNHETENE